MHSVCACVILCVLALAAPATSSAATKIDEGFTTRLTRDGDPANKVSSAHTGDEVYYWIQWKDHPVGHATFRCVVRDEAHGTTLYDESETAEDATAEGFSLCGYEFEDGGTFRFVQYLDGEKVGERAISIDAGSIWKLSMKRKFKWALGGLACIILAIGWIVKKRRGRGEPPDAVADPEGTMQPMGRAAIVIGSKVGEEALGRMLAASAPAANGDADELRKSRLQYEQLIAGADKPKALEAGRRYLGLLVKGRSGAEALKVFKECLALDSSFRPERGEDVLPIAKAARAAGDPQAAIAVLRSFDKIYPGHSQIPEVYVFSARLMAEELGNKDMARKILEHVVQKHPGHYIAQEAKKLLQTLAPPA